MNEQLICYLLHIEYEIGRARLKKKEPQCRTKADNTRSRNPSQTHFRVLFPPLVC